MRGIYFLDMSSSSLSYKPGLPLLVIYYVPVYPFLLFFAVDVQDILIYRARNSYLEIHGFKLGTAATQNPIAKKNHALVQTLFWPRAQSGHTNY